jgi:hypothetical protein
MLANHTGYLKYPLTAQSGGDNPSLSAGQVTTFSLSSIPAFEGNLANYVYGLLLMVSGTITQAGGAGSSITADRLVQAIVSSLNVRNAWYGTPVNAAWWNGGMVAYHASYVINGYRQPWRARNPIPAANGATAFVIELFIPLHLGVGRKPHHTAPLALMLDQALLDINVQAASQLTFWSAGATFSSLTCRCTALVLPDPELRIGPVPEFAQYQAQVPAAASFNARFEGVGNNTGITGVEAGAGIVWATLLSSIGGNNFGSGTACNWVQLTRIGVPFRGQVETGHVGAFVSEAIDAMGPQRIIGSANESAQQTLSDYNGYPYVLGVQSATSSSVELDATSSGGLTGATAGLWGLPIVSPGHQLELTKVQHVSETLLIPLTFSSAQTGGSLNLATLQLKTFTEQKREAWRERVISSGLARRVLGDANSFDDYVWEAKLLNKQDPSQMDPRKFRFLPLKLANRSAR